MPRSSIRWLSVLVVLFLLASLGWYARSWLNTPLIYHVREFSVEGYQAKGSWMQTRGGKFRLVYLYAVPLGTPIVGCANTTHVIPASKRKKFGPADAWVDGLYRYQEKLTKNDVPSVWVWSNKEDRPIRLAENLQLSHIVRSPHAFNSIKETSIWRDQIKSRLDEETEFVWRKEWEQLTPVVANLVPWDVFVHNKRTEHNQAGGEWELDQ
jgi:hypothetical protein